MRGDSEAPPLEGELVELQVLAEVHEHNAAALSPCERAAGRRRQPESSAQVAPAPRARRRVAAGLVGLVAAAASESASANAASGSGGGGGGGGGGVGGGGGGGATRARRGFTDVWEECGMARGQVRRRQQQQLLCVPPRACAQRRRRQPVADRIVDEARARRGAVPQVGRLDRLQAGLESVLGFGLGFGSGCGPGLGLGRVTGGPPAAVRGARPTAEAEPHASRARLGQPVSGES